jgi:hypothetical protein
MSEQFNLLELVEDIEKLEKDALEELTNGKEENEDE